MYCERCGKQLDEALNFCNGCGAQLKKSGESEHKSLLNTMVTGLIVIASAGLGMLAVILPILLDRVPRIEPVIAFALFYLTALVAICWMIMRQVSKVLDAKLGAKNIYETVNPQPQAFVHLPPKTTAQLEEQREPASVVDVTTRTLEEVPLRRH
jgi:hypothetical protein